MVPLRMEKPSVWWVSCLLLLMAQAWAAKSAALAHYDLPTAVEMLARLVLLAVTRTLGPPAPADGVATAGRRRRLQCREVASGGRAVEA